MDGANRRRFERYNIRIAAVLMRGRSATPTHTEDVSFTGLFLRTMEDVPLRQLVRIKLMPPGENEELQLMGMAVHRVPPGGRRPPGVGVLLYGIDPSTRARWESMVQRVRMGVHSAPARTAAPPPVPAPAAPAPASAPPVPSSADLPYHPEIRVRVPHIQALRTIASRDLARGRTVVGTALFLAPGTEVRLILVHPDTAREFRLDGRVRRQVRKGTATGLDVELSGVDEALLRRVEEFVEDEVHVTVDMDATFLDDLD
ncbi:MAG: PilZ domain-containing protein [Myxococcales bacterium]|nr:PilZ domain-containing protein [Myxococcales bacterium]